MCTDDNALGRKTTHVFKLVYGEEFAAKWAEHSWAEAPTKFVATPNCGVVFLGFEGAPHEQRRGFLIPAQEALMLAKLLRQNAEIAIQLGEIHD